jgi:hypothetical protein
MIQFGGIFVLMGQISRTVFWKREAKSSFKSFHNIYQSCTSMEARYVPHLLFRRVSCFVADEWESSATGSSGENSILRLLSVIQSNLPAFSIGSSHTMKRWWQAQNRSYEIPVEVTDIDICTVQWKHRGRRTKISTGDKQWQLEWHWELQNAMWCLSMKTTSCSMNNGGNINGKKKHRNWTQVFWDATQCGWIS